MSLRAALFKVVNHGRGLLRGGVKLNWKQFDQPKRTIIQTEVVQGGRSGLQGRFQTARRILLDNVLRRVTNSLSSDLRERTTKQLLFGNATPFFALVGVSLASGTGIITKEDELEGICLEIREAVARMQQTLSKAESDSFEPNEELGLGSFTVGPFISKGANAVVYAARKEPNPPPRSEQVAEGSAGCNEEVRLAELGEPLTKFPFALKMMFNYDAESNAYAVIRSMLRETVPARFRPILPLADSLAQDVVPLPPHPNIATVHCAFAAQVPFLPEALERYDVALPRRLNPDGAGRNMTMFLVMKRYDSSLEVYLRERGTPPVRESVLLLAQLLAAVAHMTKHGVAHRDLKSDNILVEMTGDGCPSLVVTDFGCCLADKRVGLDLPFRTYDTDRGGNPALMAPEVKLAEPGLFKKISYARSDAWAVGTLAYEMFGQRNPFTRGHDGSPPLLDSGTYRETQLPPLGDSTPLIVRAVVQALLARNPSQRLRADEAMVVLCLYLWAPSHWLKPYDYESRPSSSEVLQWLLCLSTKVLCTDHGGRVAARGASSTMHARRRCTAENELMSSFLISVPLRKIHPCLNFMHAALAP